MTRTESHQGRPDIAPARRFSESVAVVLVLTFMACALHAPSLFFPSRFAFSPADILARQPELGGSPAYVPANRLLIDPVLQFEPWDAFVRAEVAEGRFPWYNPLAGTGVPLAANGQSRLFDPVAWAFRLAPSPWNRAAESTFLFVLAGWGSFLLCRDLGLGRQACCWCGVMLPLSGFFTLWRLYPLNASATALPWVWLAFVRLSERASPRRTALTAAATAWLIVAGNVQIAAVGLVGVGAHFAKSLPGTSRDAVARTASAFAVAIGLGLALSAPAWSSLAEYLSRSPIWADRLAEHSAEGRGARPRWADLPGVVLPFVFGSERRGDANVAKAVGASNVNEAASAHIGLYAPFALIPAAIVSDLRKRSLARWAAAATFAGLWIAYRLPPIHYVWAGLPVLQGIDPRRFVVLAVFGGIVLAGIGLEALAAGSLGQRFESWAPRVWTLAAIGCAGVACTPFAIAERLEAQARSHYEKSVEPGPDRDRIVAVRVRDQIDGLKRSWPVYMIGRAAWLAALVVVWRSTKSRPPARAVAVGVLAVSECFAFGWNYNPHLDRSALARSLDLRLIDTMRTLAEAATAKGHEARFLAVGECLPPNQLMRYGLKDLRNYDSIELAATLEGLDALFETEAAQDRSSRRPIAWAGVSRAADTLKDRGVVGVAGLTEPPEGLFEIVLTPLPGVFLGVWPSRPKAEGPAEIVVERPGEIVLKLRSGMPAAAVSDTSEGHVVRIRESFDPGWRAVGADAADVRLEEEPRTGFLRLVAIETKPGAEIRLRYRPIGMGWSLAASSAGAVVCTFGVLLTRMPRKKWLVSYFSVRRARG
jgi:hypothetical protein